MKGDEFKFLFPIDERQHLALKAEVALDERQEDAELEQGDDRQGPQGKVLQTIVDKTDIRRTPYPKSVFEKTVRELLNWQYRGRMLGFYRYSNLLRSHQVRSLFFTGQKEIPRTDKFDYRLPCCRAHPELCAQKNSGCMDQVAL